jgi:hypothetical protein
MKRLFLICVIIIILVIISVPMAMAEKPNDVQGWRQAN